MARMNLELPLELMEELKKLEVDSDKMFSEMTQESAKKVYANVKNNMKRSFSDTSRLEKCLKVTKTYKTPSDDGINTKIGIYGYFINKNGKRVPAPLVANAREYGTSRGETRKPFFRKSFKQNEINEIMLQVQNKYLPKE